MVNNHVIQEIKNGDVNNIKLGCAVHEELTTEFVRRQASRVLLELRVNLDRRLTDRVDFDRS